MSLLTDISTIISGLYPAATNLFSSKFNANYQAYLTEISAFPLIIIDNELSKNAEIKQNNSVMKDSRVFVTILKLDSEDNTDTQSEVLRAACETIADRIAVNIYQKLPVRPTGNQKYKLTPMFKIFGTKLTGVALDMQVNYNETVNFNQLVIP